MVCSTRRSAVVSAYLDKTVHVMFSLFIMHPCTPTCSGVNMYAMLTGCLPYTVEPFNITALHAKMLENKMNPIPSTLSQGGWA